jgi:nicotinate phosphoribosyltransferase
MMTDLYQLTMMYGYHFHHRGEEAVFDLFFRKTTGANSAYAVMAGLEQAVEYILDLHFSDEDIAYLRTLKLFDEPFLEVLRSFRFTGDIYAVPEGTPVFPGEPLMRVKAPIMQAQLLETALLTIVNHQTLIATKASRVCYAAGKDGRVLEFGLRRAQGPDAGIYGARAAIIGGCIGTSNVLTGQMFDVPVKGTHGHSWVMAFDSELEAFRAYAEAYPDGCLLLVDTYDTLRTGVPNAITVFSELRERGHKPVGIRLDSGDLAYLSKKSREMLDAAGFEDALIFASSDLDEEIIYDLRAQGARIDVWGVGTKLITSENAPSLGGVYKMSAIERNGVLEPRIKLSDSIGKITNPGYKKVYRIYDKRTRRALADLVCLENETYDETEPLTIFDPVETYKRMTITDYTLRPLLEPVFVRGKLVRRNPDLKEIEAYAKAEMATLWDEYKRLSRAHIYKVDLSQPLYDLKQALIREQSGNPGD